MGLRHSSALLLLVAVRARTLVAAAASARLADHVAIVSRRVAFDGYLTRRRSIGAPSEVSFARGWCLWG